MNLIRQSFAKHYCPRCDSRTRRVRSSFGEDLVQYSVFVLLYVPAYLVIGFFVESFGGPEILAWLLGFTHLGRIGRFPVVTPNPVINSDAGR